MVRMERLTLALGGTVKPVFSITSFDDGGQMVSFQWASVITVFLKQLNYFQNPSLSDLKV